MIVNTRVFGEIEIQDDKIITFESGIIGFSDLKKFALIFDEEKGDSRNIIWLQSIDEPAFAMPVMNPLTIKENYNPLVEEELLSTIGKLEPENTLVMVTVTVPQVIENISINLKAPLVINAETRKAVQVIVENEEIKFPIYDIIKADKEKAGE